MKFRSRAIHRDLGYFYLGLIVSFALSGIMMNHRAYWHPEKYTLSTRPIEVVLPDVSDIDEKFIKTFVTNELEVHDKVKRHMLRKNQLKIFCENHVIELDMKSGKGEIIEFKKTPFISEIYTLHRSNSNWWIYYSDIFGLSLITIAITGILIIPKGKNSFGSRGWKLALAGIVVPVMVLIFIL